MPTYQEGFYGGDLVIDEGASPLVTREELEVTNDHAENKLILGTGRPLKSDGSFIFATNDSELSATYGLVIHQTVIQPGETRKVAVLRRGPAAINKAALAQYYLDATSYLEDTESAIDADTFETQVEANLTLVIVRDEPENVEQQTT